MQEKNHSNPTDIALFGMFIQNHEYAIVTLATEKYCYSLDRILKPSVYWKVLWVDRRITIYIDYHEYSPSSLFLSSSCEAFSWDKIGLFPKEDLTLTGLTNGQIDGEDARGCTQESQAYSSSSAWSAGNVQSGNCVKALGEQLLPSFSWELICAGKFLLNFDSLLAINGEQACCQKRENRKSLFADDMIPGAKSFRKRELALLGTLQNNTDLDQLWIWSRVC